LSNPCFSIASLCSAELVVPLGSTSTTLTPCLIALSSPCTRSCFFANLDILLLARELPVNLFFLTRKRFSKAIVDAPTSIAVRILGLVVVLVVESGYCCGDFSRAFYTTKSSMCTATSTDIAITFIRSHTVLYWKKSRGVQANVHRYNTGHGGVFSWGSLLETT